MTRALVIIDIQQDYFAGGAHPLVGPDAAADAAAGLLAHFRAQGEPVIHVQQLWDAPDATFMRPGTSGCEIHHLVAPLPGESVVQKAAPNLEFEGTALPGEIVHASFMAALADGYAQVVSSREVIERSGAIR